MNDVLLQVVALVAMLLIPLTEENTRFHPVTKLMNTSKFKNKEAIQKISL